MDSGKEKAKKHNLELGKVDSRDQDPETPAACKVSHSQLDKEGMKHNGCSKQLDTARGPSLKKMQLNRPLKTNN